MRVLLTATLLVAVIAALCHGEQTNTSSGLVTTKIIVRVLNGKDGKPIKHSTLGVWLSDGVKKNYRTNDDGEVVLTIGNPQAREIEVRLTNFYIDCETYGNEDGRLTRFSLDEVASKGFVAENRCGPYRTNPMPGALIVYERKMTRKERRAI
jgi:hypothetical protein